LDGGAPVTLDCYYPTATTSQTRRLLFSGVAAGQHTVVITLSGNKNPSSRLVLLLRFPGMRSRERRSRSGFDDYRRGGRDRLRYGQHLQAIAAEAGVEHSEARAAGRDRPLLRRVLVEAVGGFQSVLPAMHDHVLRQLERSGCRLAARRRLGDRQNSLRRQDSSSTIARHFANFINAIFDGVWASLRAASSRSRLIPSAACGSTTCTRAATSNTGSGQATVTGDLQGGTYGVRG